MLTECQLLKIYLSIDLVTDLIHPLCQCQTQAWFSFWFWSKRRPWHVPSQVPEPSYDNQMATTETQTAPDDDDEWVLIVNYKSHACSGLWFSSCCGSTVVSGWCQSIYEELSHDSLVNVGVGVGVKCSGCCCTCLTFKLRIGLCFLVFLGLPADMWDIWSGRKLSHIPGALPKFSVCGIKCQIYGAYVNLLYAPKNLVTVSIMHFICQLD